MTFLYSKGSAFVFFVVLFVSAPIYAQTVPMSKIQESVLSTSDRTYVSFGQGLGNNKTQYGIRRINPLIFEGQISPDFFISLSKKRTVGFIFFPKIVIRMYNETSFPVRTPSYMPNLLFYHKLNLKITKKIFPFFKYEEQQAFMTYRVMHHSNGQDGDYLIKGTDSVNYKNGNFSTNAFEVAYSWSVIDSGFIGKAFVNGRIAYERQLDFEREPQMKNTYYYNKLSVENHIVYSEKIKVYVTYAFMWGTHQFGNRNSIDVFISMKPIQNLADFSIFMRGYMGPDYYNLYYENQLRAFTIGIIVDPMKIPILKRLNKKPD